MQIVKNLIKQGLYYCGIYGLYYHLKTSTEKRLLILMYHDLVEDDAPDANKDFQFEKPNRSQFAAHLSILRKYYRVVSVEQAMREIQKEGKLQQNSVAITFDDGYASVYHIAFPLLKKYNFPATIYPITKWVNKEMIPWWESLGNMVRKGDISKSSIAHAEKILGIRLVNELEKISDNHKLKRTFLKRVEAVLRQKEDNQRRQLIDALKTVIMKEGNHEPDDCASLTWEEIKRMAGCGIEFGAHTCSHANLSHAGMDLVEKEITESKLEIERHLGEKVKGFAYPYGMDITAYRRIEPILIKHGFEYACSASPGVNTHFSDPYLLRRVSFPATASIALLAWALLLDFKADIKEPDQNHVEHMMERAGS